MYGDNLAGHGGEGAPPTVLRLSDEAETGLNLARSKDVGGAPVSGCLAVTTFEGSAAHTLNYDVRVLGREGVLSMNAVASMSQLAQIRSDMRPLIEIAEFNGGHRYAEFNSKTDRMAEYGLGALIAGGVAAKLGLFGKLAALLVAFKKFIILGLVAVGGFFAKLFKKKDAAA